MYLLMINYYSWFINHTFSGNLDKYLASDNEPSPVIFINLPDLNTIGSNALLSLDCFISTIWSEFGTTDGTSNCIAPWRWL